jgi:hypothetical protein
VRVHDVAATRQALAYARALERQRRAHSTPRWQPRRGIAPARTGAEPSPPDQDQVCLDEGSSQPSVGGGAGG